MIWTVGSSLGIKKSKKIHYVSSSPQPVIETVGGDADGVEDGLQWVALVTEQLQQVVAGVQHPALLLAAPPGKVKVHAQPRGFLQVGGQGRGRVGLGVRAALKGGFVAPQSFRDGGVGLALVPARVRRRGC